MTIKPKISDKDLHILIENSIKDCRFCPIKLLSVLRKLGLISK